MVLPCAARPFGLGPEQEGAVDHHRLAGLQPVDDFNLTAEVTTATYRPDLEAAVGAWDEHAPTVFATL
jgi:hypothetical protein